MFRPDQIHRGLRFSSPSEGPPVGGVIASVEQVLGMALAPAFSELSRRQGGTPARSCRLEQKIVLGCHCRPGGHDRA